jgi:hypothetical protein
MLLARCSSPTGYTQGVSPDQGGSPSNSGGTCPDNGHPSIGLDRVTVSFPVAEHEHDAGAWDSRRTKREGTPAEYEALRAGVEVADDVRVFVSAFQTENARWWGRVDFNPARVLDPGGHGLAPVASIREVISETLESVQHLARPACATGDLRITRLDIARDFEGVENPAGTLQGLVALPRKWAKSISLDVNPSSSACETLSVRSGKAGMVRLYDKWVETDGAVAVGTLRFEAECRKDWLRNYGAMRVLDDVDEGRVEELAWNRWEWSQMGVVLVGQPDDLVAAVGKLGLGGMEALRLIGWVVVQGADGGIRPASRTTEAKLRQLARQLGIGLSPDFPGSAVARRLDFDSGREVVAAV